jgi:hypothetical protein
MAKPEQPWPIMVALISKSAVAQHLGSCVNGKSMAFVLNQCPCMNAKGVPSFSPGLRDSATLGTAPADLNPERVASVPHSSRTRFGLLAHSSRPECRGLSKTDSHLFALLYSRGRSRLIPNQTS